MRKSEWREQRRARACARAHDRACQLREERQLAGPAPPAPTDIGVSGEEIASFTREVMETAGALRRLNDHANSGIPVGGLSLEDYVRRGMKVLSYVHHLNFNNCRTRGRNCRMREPADCQQRARAKPGRRRPLRRYWRTVTVKGSLGGSIWTRSLQTTSQTRHSTELKCTRGSPMTASRTWVRTTFWCGALIGVPSQST